MQLSEYWGSLLVCVSSSVKRAACTNSKQAVGECGWKEVEAKGTLRISTGVGV